MGTQNSDSLRLIELFPEAIRTLTVQQLRAYHLHLLGWMNQEIAEHLQLQPSQVSLLLHLARQQVRDFVQQTYGWVGNTLREKLTALLREDPELLSELIMSQHSTAREAEPEEQSDELLRRVEMVGQVKDACILEGRENKDVFRVAEFLNVTLSGQEKQELHEQLEEYIAAQDGLERLVDTRLAPGAFRKAVPGDVAAASGFTILTLVARVVQQQRRRSYHVREDENAMRVHRRDINIWQLVTEQGEEGIPLSTEIAQQCYGRPEQTVKLRLHCVPVADGPGLCMPRVEAYPAPTQDTLHFEMVFANEEKRVFSIPVPRRNHSDAWSQRCDPLTMDAFGTEEWQVSVGLQRESMPLPYGLLHILDAVVNSPSSLTLPGRPADTVSFCSLSPTKLSGSTYSTTHAYGESGMTLSKQSLSFAHAPCVYVAWTLGGFHVWR